MNSKKIKILEDKQKTIQKIVWAHFKDFYLTGGTALAFHFKHRFSEDLDFFTQNYHSFSPEKVMDLIQKETGFGFELISEQTNKKFVPMQIYSLNLTGDIPLKIDFVQDAVPNIEKTKKGIHSIQDIFFRKCSIGIQVTKNKEPLGQQIPGGRQTAKDIFDLYYLSKNYQPISEFCLSHFPIESLENLCSWYRRFSRMDLKLDLQDLITDEKTSKIIPHLDNEILKKITDELI